MNAIRNIYIYLVSFITTQIVIWATIYLGRNLLLGDLNRENLAWQIALLVIAGPLWLIHWQWAQRLARQDNAERVSFLRSLYLYGLLTVLLVPLMEQIYGFLTNGLSLLLRLEVSYADPSRALQESLIALLLLGVAWGYHDFVRREDEQSAAPPTQHPVLPRLYRWLFTVGSLFVGVTVLIDLWGMVWRLAVDNRVGDFRFYMVSDIAALIVTAVVWVLFWRWNQQLFEENKLDEQRSFLRKLALYLIIFITALTAVGNAIILLADLFGRIIGIDLAIELASVVPLLILPALVWAYHTFVLHQDTQRIPTETIRQAALRRLYWYTLAGIGLTAVVGGVGGALSLLIRQITREVTQLDLREEAVWYLAAISVGLLVWLGPWRLIQQMAQQTNEQGVGEKRSLIRRIYLFGFLFAATMTILGSTVYLVYRLLTQLLGISSQSSLFTDVAHALAYALLATAVLSYHGWLLRQDQMEIADWLAAQYARLRLTIVGGEADPFGAALAAAIPEAIPGLQVTFLGLAPVEEGEGMDITTTLQESNIIITPWRILLADSDVDPVVRQALTTSSAQKLLLPTSYEGWHWVGLELNQPDKLMEKAIEEIRLTADRQLHLA